MPKIESIRPGGTLSATFGDYPLPELLFGILRGNLTGKLEVGLHPEPRNAIYFRDGVPIAVDLRDGKISIITLLIESGELEESQGLALLDRGGNELELLRTKVTLPPGRLGQLDAARARRQIVRLFNAGPIEFSFHEGADRPSAASLTILQPLPIVYEGLTAMQDRAVVDRWVRDLEGKAFVLAGTYPRGVDPFEWGEETDRHVLAMEEPSTLQDLIQRGLDSGRASAVMVSLSMAGMIEEAHKKAQPAPAAAAPKMDPRLRPPPAAKADRDEVAKEPSGLVIHYKSGRSTKAGRPSSSPEAAAEAPAPKEPAAPVESDRGVAAIRSKLAQHEGKNYFQILRVATSTDMAQVERAYRFLIRRPDSAEDDATRALKGLYHEAFECLSDPERLRRYKALVEWAEKSTNAVREREAIEAEPKVDRAVRCLGDGHFAEARALLEWAKKLDPLRSDAPALLELARYMAHPEGGDLLSIATTFVAERQKNPDDVRIRLAYAYCLAEENEAKAAKALIESISDREHPLARRVAAIAER